jgi:hypothetical protein
MVCLVTIAILVIFQSAALAGETEAPPPEKLPGVVMKALLDKFPEAKLQKWDREVENDTVMYDVEFTQDDRHFEADIRENGSIVNWERELKEVDLPDEVRVTMQSHYPGSVVLQAMEIMIVGDNTDTLEGYEITLETVDKEQIEIMVAPDGKLMEEGKAEQD